MWLDLVALTCSIHASLMVRRKDQPVKAMFSITLNNLWLCLTEQSVLAYWKLDQYRAFQKTPPAMPCGQHYTCRKIVLDIHLRFPCYLAQLVLVFCFILDVILKKTCKVLVFEIIETHNFTCLWLKNIGKTMKAETPSLNENCDVNMLEKNVCYLWDLS